MKRVYIFLNGSGTHLEHIQFDDNALIICADGGAKHALGLGIPPDIVIGDLDSIDARTLSILETQSVKIIRHPREKDETDSQLAVQYAVDHGYNDLVIVGLLGDRIDHLSANLMYLCDLSKNHTITVIEGQQETRFVHDHLSIFGTKGDEVSLIPFKNDVSGIVTEGLAYQLKDETLPFGATRGVSNVMTASRAEMHIRNGVLMVVHRKRFFENLK